MEKDKTMIECPFCEGNGRGRDPDAQPDPVEMYKMANWVACLACQGLGKVQKHSELGHFFVSGQKAARAWKKRYIEEKEREEARRQRERIRALEKLTPEEQEVLGLLV